MLFMGPVVCCGCFEACMNRFCGPAGWGRAANHAPLSHQCKGWDQLGGENSSGGNRLSGGCIQCLLSFQEKTGDYFIQDLELVEQSLCENSYDPELAIIEVLQLMSFKESGYCITPHHVDAVHSLPCFYHHGV